MSSSTNASTMNTMQASLRALPNQKYLVEEGKPCALQRPRFHKYAVPQQPKPDSPDSDKWEDDHPLAPVFDGEEFPERLAKLRELMKDEGLDIAILTSMHNVKYLSNFLYCSFGRTYALVVSQTHVTLLSTGIDSFGPRRMIRYNGHANQCHIIYTDWNKWNFFEALKSSVPDFCSATRIGFEADHMNVKLRTAIAEYCFSNAKPTEVNFAKETNAEWSGIPAKQAEEGEQSPLKRRKTEKGDASDASTEAGTPREGGQPQFFDISAELMTHRLVKSPGEVKLIKQACQIANAGCDVLLANLELGISESDLASLGVAKMKKLICKGFPSTELMDTWIWMQFGVNTDGAHNAQTTRQLQKGDLLSFNCFPMIDGYYVALERTGMFMGDKFANEAHNAEVPDLKALLQRVQKGDSSVEVGKITMKQFWQVAADMELEQLKDFLFSANGVVPSMPADGVVLRDGNFVNSELQKLGLDDFLVNFLSHVYYWKINVLVFETGRDLLQTGATLKGIAAELNEVFAKYRVLQYRTFGYGHSFGVLCHFYGRETILEIREDNEQVLKPGMVVSMEPHITIPEGCFGAGGYREHDILLMKPDGARSENITNFKYGPKQMTFF